MTTRQLEFYNQFGKVGTLNFDGDKLTFSGDADQSAEVFFESVIQFFGHKLREAYLEGYEDAKREKVN